MLIRQRCSRRLRTWIIILSCLILYTSIANILRILFHIEISNQYYSLCPYTSRTVGNLITFDDSSYNINHYPEFICPQNFRNMADWIFGWPNGVFEEKLEYPWTRNMLTVPNLPNGSIIYVKPDSLSIFFSRIYPYLSNKFVLISGQSDQSVPNEHFYHLTEPDSKIIHWFGQNGNIYSSMSDRFTHIPIGINCFEMAENIRSIHREHTNSTLPRVFHNSADEPFEYIQPFDITSGVLNKTEESTKLVLLNFQPNTDPTGIRAKIWEKFCNNERQSAFVCFNKPDGVDIKGLTNIYKRNRQYPLWLAPRGNGIDTHRTWEALYLDIIPIVWNSTLNPLYEDLPVIVVQDFDEINEKFLRTKLREIASKKIQRPSMYKYEKLRNAFWRQMIFSKSRYAQQNTNVYEHRCWRGKIIS